MLGQRLMSDDLLSTPELSLLSSRDTLQRSLFAASCAPLFPCAAVSTTLTWVTGNPVYDAIGSMAVGALMGGIAIMLIRNNKQFLIGALRRAVLRARWGSLASSRRREGQKCRVIFKPAFSPPRCQQSQLVISELLMAPSLQYLAVHGGGGHLFAALSSCV
jgi:hypothetical protein